MILAFFQFILLIVIFCIILIFFPGMNISPQTFCHQSLNYSLLISKMEYATAFNELFFVQLPFGTHPVLNFDSVFNKFYDSFYSFSLNRLIDIYFDLNQILYFLSYYYDIDDKIKLFDNFYNYNNNESLIDEDLKLFISHDLPLYSLNIRAIIHHSIFHMGELIQSFAKLSFDEISFEQKSYYFEKILDTSLTSYFISHACRNLILNQTEEEISIVHEKGIFLR